MTIDTSDVTAEFAAAQAMPTGDIDRGAGPEDNFDDEGYDETQRAEILEVESTGPNNGTIQTDLAPDMGGGDADDDEIEDDEDELDTVVDTDAAFTGGTSVLGEDEGADDAEDFDVDDEETPGDENAGQIGA